MNLHHLYHRIMGYIKPFDTKDAKFIVTYYTSDKYALFVPGIRKFLKSNGCTYQNDFIGGLCCFEGVKVEIDRQGILALASKGYYKSIMNYLREITITTKVRALNEPSY